MLTARSRRAKNRLREHDLQVIRSGVFQGQHAILTRCADPDCRCTGWFTDAEMVLTDLSQDG